MTILVTAKSLSHPGFTWVAVLDQCGCLDYLRKPIRDDALEEVIKRLAPRGFADRMELPATDEPAFLLPSEVRSC